MSLPRKLKNFNLFVVGLSYAGLVPEITLPKLSRKTEDYRAGGMGGPIKSLQGLEALEMQWTLAGYDFTALAQWGSQSVGGLLLRFAGALQSEDSGAISSVEVVMRGAHTEVDFGAAKAGDKTEIKISTALSYYKLSLNNLPLIEIDVVNLIERVGGVDLAVDERAAIGL